jgi:hypothetical protein
MQKKLVLATNYNNWEGLYIDGVLVLEGHLIRREEMFTVLGINYTEVEIAEGWLESRGNFLPKKLSDVEEM